MAKFVKRPAESWAFVLESDRALPPEQQTRFTLRAMTINDRAAARDDLTRELVGPDGTRIIQRRTRQHSLMLAISNIVAIENFPVGAARSWPDDLDARERYLEQLNDRDVLEIANEIWRRSDGLDDAAKNSSPPERTSASGDAPVVIPPSTPASDASSSPG